MMVKRMRWLGLLVCLLGMQWAQESWGKQMRVILKSGHVGLIDENLFNPNTMKQADAPVVASVQRKVAKPKPVVEVPAAPLAPVAEVPAQVVLSQPSHNAAALVTANLANTANLVKTQDKILTETEKIQHAIQELQRAQQVLLEQLKSLQGHKQATAEEIARLTAMQETLNQLNAKFDTTVLPAVGTLADAAVQAPVDSDVKAEVNKTVVAANQVAGRFAFLRNLLSTTERRFAALAGAAGLGYYGRNALTGMASSALATKGGQWLTSGLSGIRSGTTSLANRVLKSGASQTALAYAKKIGGKVTDKRVAGLLTATGVSLMALGAYGYKAGAKNMTEEELRAHNALPWYQRWRHNIQNLPFKRSQELIGLGAALTAVGIGGAASNSEYIQRLVGSTVDKAGFGNARNTTNYATWDETQRAFGASEREAGKIAAEQALQAERDAVEGGFVGAGLTNAEREALWNQEAEISAIDVKRQEARQRVWDAREARKEAQQLEAQKLTENEEEVARDIQQNRRDLSLLSRRLSSNRAVTPFANTGAYGVGGNIDPLDQYAGWSDAEKAEEWNRLAQAAELEKNKLEQESEDLEREAAYSQFEWQAEQAAAEEARQLAEAAQQARFTADAKNYPVLPVINQ